MANVHNLLPTIRDFYYILQNRANYAESVRHQRFTAANFLIRIARGYLIRKHIAWLNYNATIIQCALRCHLARKAYRAALRNAVKNQHNRHYAQAATKIQALWRGHYSRRTLFCYRTYRHWLYLVRERGERRAAEAAEFGIRSRADDLRILEEEARQWLAFVVFKLHHLLRTYSSAGIYSEPATNELSDFERLLTAIHYTEYMKRLKRKYDQFVRKHRPAFSNKRLFPIIGDGAEYWYLSLPEMYELTLTTPTKKNYRHKATHHGKIHTEPFLWKKVVPQCPYKERGPFTLPRGKGLKMPPGPPTPTPAYSVEAEYPKDPRFHLYLQHYKPQPALFDYVDFHINVLIKHRDSVQNIELEETQ